MQQLWFLHFARPLMLFDTHRKFCDDILNVFQVIEWTRLFFFFFFFFFFVTDKVPTEIIKKCINARFMVLALCMLIDID